MTSRLLDLRVERGISRQDLADAVGVHYQTVGYLERGEYSPSLALALRICAVLEVTVEECFSLADQAGPVREVESMGGRR